MRGRRESAASPLRSAPGDTLADVETNPQFSASVPQSSFAALQIKALFVHFSSFQRIFSAYFAKFSAKFYNFSAFDFGVSAFARPSVMLLAEDVENCSGVPMYAVSYSAFLPNFSTFACDVSTFAASALQRHRESLAGSAGFQPAGSTLSTRPPGWRRSQRLAR